MTWRTRTLALLATVLLASMARAEAPVVVTPGSQPQDVKVERVKKKREKRPTLRFLKENKDFIRAQLDYLRQTARDADGRSGDIDERWLVLRDMMYAAEAGRDSVLAQRVDWDQRELLTRISELSDLEAELDYLEVLLAKQAERLGRLEADFVGRQETALVILLRGMPRVDRIDALVVTEENGSVTTIDIDATEWASLREGGVAQLYHEFAEPREQVLEMRLVGASLDERTRGYITMTPARDWLTFLELDLSNVETGRGADALTARVWTYDPVASLDDTQ